ncbi:putative periplasmic binding protein [Candidatus Terasakiella magnetica]|uniref:Putative periplasmic binding protein n=1 Tax=Candidatus Terasakiella magnetica TaxID=1867952 RepID=A0A1C3RKM4_9PROT|nr:transporter substrate-binding domain-containing protein [Candidatus Terasakiella magnetica]SCA57798.1 putative periplasmic binding protein [Candidatus Terasakiella magnetica]
MKKIAIALAAVLGLGISVADAGDKLRIGTEGAYPPFNGINKEGKAFGFDVDIANALCAEMKVECEIIAPLEWDSILIGLKKKKYDAVVASMSITEERKKAVSFTEPYYSNNLTMVAKKGSGLKAHMLRGKNIGAQRATIAANYVTDNMMGVNAKLYDTQENAYLDLASGRIEVLVSDKLPAYDWLRSEAGQGFEFLGKAIDVNDKIGIAVRKKDNDLREKMNAAIKAIVANGTYAKINEKYFPFSIY